MLSVRIVTTDHYMAPPVRDVDVCYSEFRAIEVKRVPVMRIYGSTEAGQKTCMHIHGIFPYLYVPYDGSEPVHKYLRQVATSIDKAVNIGMGRAASTTQHVYKITLVNAVPFYGYHDREQQFLKIYLYNPFMVKRVADLLLGGAIMNKILQPHESHIPYNLQAFIDYNLYGMNMIKVDAAKFRQPDDGLPAETFAGDSHSQRSFSLNTPPQEMHWDLSTIPSDAWLPPTVLRQSYCELEVDVVAADILNRSDIGENIGTNPGLAALWDDERQRRREHADDSHISPPSSPDRGSIPWTDDEAELQERLQNILIELQPYINDGDQATPNSSQKESITPSSQVESHHSLADDLFSVSSQDTLILEADTSAEPIVNETSILRVVSSSQSFQGSAPKPAGILDNTQDKQLAEMLAAMGDEGDVACSQAASQALSRVATLEDADSVLSQTSSTHVRLTPQQQADNEAQEEQEERDMLDLSQSAWHDDIPEATEDLGKNQSSTQWEMDMEGMDQSWNSSQWVEVLAAKGEEEEGLPQYDGPADDKIETQSSTKKRLGMLGATLPTFKVKTISPGAFSITAKTNEDTLITFTSSTKMHPIRTNKAKPASKQTKPGPASRTAPVAAPQSLRFDLRASELKQMSGGAEDEENSSSQTYKKRSQEGLTKGVGRIPGKNSPKEGSRASDAFVELSSRSQTKQTSQHKSPAGRESRGATAKSNSKTNTSPKKGSTTRIREGRPDNIFASLASELHPQTGSSKQKAKSPPKDTPSTSSSKPSTVNDARIEMFIKKTRARLSLANSKPKVSTVTEASNTKRTPRINSKTNKASKGIKQAELTSEDELRESENEFEGKRLLIPRRRSSDSSSENEVLSQTETMKAPNCPQKKPNGEIKKKLVAPTLEDESERVEKASEVSDDQMSLRVDPDPESDHEMWDQTGCDDLPVIVDLPADPMSISDSEQQDEGPLTYEEHSTVIISKPSRKSPKARKISGSEKNTSHGHDNKQKQDSATKKTSTHTAYTGTKTKLELSTIGVSNTSDIHGAQHSLDTVKHTVTQPKPGASKSGVSLAERKRKLSLKRLLKKREDALEQLRRHGGHNVSDTDSYTSTELVSDSPVAEKTAMTEAAVSTECASPPAAPPSVVSPQQHDASPDIFSSSDSSPLRGAQDHFSCSSRGRGRARRGGKSRTGSTSPGSPPEKIGKKSPRGRQGRGRGQKPALQSQVSMDEQDSVWFSASNYINYYNGLCVCAQNRKTRHMAEETSTRVRVSKTDCQKYQLTDVGQEKLDLHNMNPYELIHPKEFLSKCDRRYRTYTMDLSYQKKSPGRPPGRKKQQDALGSKIEMLTTPGEDISMEIIDISSLTAEASKLKQVGEEDFGEGNQFRSIFPMEEGLEEQDSVHPASLDKVSHSPKPEDLSVSREPVFFSTKPGPKSSKRRLHPSKNGSQPSIAPTIHTSKSSHPSKSIGLPPESSANDSTSSSTIISLSTDQSEVFGNSTIQSSKLMSKSSSQSCKQNSSMTASLSSEQEQSSKYMANASKEESQFLKHASKSSNPSQEESSIQNSLSSEQRDQSVKESIKHASKSSSKFSNEESQSSKQASKSPSKSTKEESHSKHASKSSSKPSKEETQSSKHAPKSSSKTSKEESQSSKQTSKSSSKPQKEESHSSKHGSKSSSKPSKEESQSSKHAPKSSSKPSKEESQSSKQTSKSSSKPQKEESRSSKHSSKSSSKPSKEESQSSKHASKSSSKPLKEESQSSKYASKSSSKSTKGDSHSSKYASKSSSKPSKEESQFSKQTSLSSEQDSSCMKPTKQSVEPMSKSSESSKKLSPPSKHFTSSLRPSSHSPRAAPKTTKQIVSKSSSSHPPKAPLLATKEILESSTQSSTSSIQSLKAASEHSDSTQVSKQAQSNVPTPGAASTKGETTTRSHPNTPRQPLLESQQSEAKGDMSVVDFSLLENPIDNDVVAILSTDADPHHQLHTPPLVMDAAKEPSSPAAEAGPSVSGHSDMQDSQGRKTQSAVQMDSDLMPQGTDPAMSSDDDGQNTVDYTHDETLTETDLYSDSNAGVGSPSASNSDGNSEVLRTETLTKQDSVSTEDSLTNNATGLSSKKRHARRPSLKMKFKKVNSESSSEAPDNQTESGEEQRQRKRRKVEQSDHYRFRAKRATVDYSSDTLTNRYKLESTKSTAPKTEEVRERKRKLKPKENIQYIIINKFKGYRSMRVLLEKLDVDIDEIVHLSDFKRRKKQKRQHSSQTNTQSFGTVRQIVSDVPHENQSDPLWEEQIERLGGDEGDADNDEDDDGSGGSSDDESSQDSANTEESRPRKGQYGTTGKGPKKRVMSYHKRMSNAFCTKTRRPKRKSEQTKIWNTLSLLHDATVAQLTSPNATYDDQVDKDHKQEYVDVMYKLALFSPPQSEHGGDSPPQPLSPASPREEQEAAIQQQDAGPRKTPSAAYHSAVLPKIAQLQQSSLDDSQGEISKSPVQLLKSSSRSSAANSPSGSDPEGHFGSRQALSSEYNSSGMNPNNTGSPYAVKETIVHFNPSKTALFNKGYSKDSSPPDLGPPTLHQMSPHSLSSNSASPPELMYQDKDLHQQQKQQPANSTSMSETYSNFFGTMPGVTHNEKKSSNFPVTSLPLVAEPPSKTDKVEKGSSGKIPEKNASAIKSSYRSLSLNRPRAGTSAYSAIDLTKGDVPAVSDTMTSVTLFNKSSGQTAVNQEGKTDMTSGPNTVGVDVCVNKKEYKHQHTKKKVLARFGIDMQASREKELALQTSAQKLGQTSKIVPERKVIPARKEDDSEETSKAKKKRENLIEKQGSEQGKDESQHSESESSEEEEYACIRSQTPPHSPGAGEMIKSEQEEKKKEKTKNQVHVVQTENDSSDCEEEEEETDEEETRKPKEVTLSPIRSPSPVAFNARCEAAVRMVPIATPRHPGGSDYQMPRPSSVYSMYNWPTRFDEPSSPHDMTTPAKSTKTKDDLRLNTLESSILLEESAVNQLEEKSEVSDMPPMAAKPQTQNTLESEGINPSLSERKKSPAVKKTAESDTEKTAESDREMYASSKTSDETEDDNESVTRNCQRIDSPIRSPSPELRHSPTPEESKEESVNLDQSILTTMHRRGRDNLSKSDLFSPSQDANSMKGSPVSQQSEEKKEDVKNGASTDSETEEDSEDEEGRIVCSPIRSLSPPASPSDSKIDVPETIKSPACNIPTIPSHKHVTEDMGKESSRVGSADSNSESSDGDDDDDDNDKDTVQNCERLSIPIRSPSPTIDMSLDQNTGKTAPEDTEPEYEVGILSSSELFSPEPHEKVVLPHEDNSKGWDDKDKEETQVSPGIKIKGEDSSRCESERSSDGSEEETEDEDAVCVPIKTFSPIRSPSPPISSPPQDKHDQSKEDNLVSIKEGSSTPTYRGHKDDTHKSMQPEGPDDSGEETEDEHHQSVQIEIFSPIRSPSPPHLSPAEPVKEDSDHEISSKPPEIPISILGSPKHQESHTPSVSPSPSPKRPSPERTVPEIRVVKMAGPMMSSEKRQSQSGIGHKKGLSMSPLPSPCAAPSEREEGEVRTDDETQEESEVNEFEVKQPLKESNTSREAVHNEEKEDGELTETSTCRSSPPPSPITISSTDELSSVKRSTKAPSRTRRDQSNKDSSGETTEEQKSPKKDQAKYLETDKEETKGVDNKEDCTGESSGEDSEDEELSHNFRYSSPIRSPSPGAGDIKLDPSSKPREDAAHVLEEQREGTVAASDQQSSSDSEESESETSRLGTPRSIRSPSPIQSPDHEVDDDAKVSVVEGSIQSPSPIQSPDQGVSLDRSGQPAVIPLTIDTSVGDPRMKRLLLHPVPSPVSSTKCTSYRTDQHAEDVSDQSEDEANLAPKMEGKLAATGKQTSGRGNVNEGAKKETHSSGHGREQNAKASDKEANQPGQPSEMSSEGAHPPTDTYQIMESNDVRRVITPAIAPPSRQSVRDSDRQSEAAHREAFYSDPYDAQQQRPREIGGRVLRIHSPLISALPESEHSFGGRSLREWQSALIAEQLQSNPALSQQSQGFNLLDEMERNPQLKASLLGNQQVVITPCRPPPTKKQVTMWSKAKALLLKLDKQEIQDLIDSKKIEKKAFPKKNDDIKSKSTNVGEEEIVQKQKQGAEPKKSSSPTVKGKGGGKGKVKNPNYTGIKRKPSDSDEALCTSASVNLPGLAVDAVEAAALVDAGFKTPARRKRRSASADDIVGSRSEAVAVTPSMEEIFTPTSTAVGRTLPSLGRRSVANSNSPPIHSTPRTGNMSFTRRVSFVESTPSCTPIKRTRPPSPDTPSTSTTPPALDSDITSSVLNRRGLVRSATPPPTGATPPYEVRRRRSVTPPPAFQHSGSSPSTTPTNTNNQQPSRHIRRLSTNTQSFLRRLIQASQSKNPLTTQLSIASGISQIEGATPKNTYGFKVSKQNVRDAKALHEFQYITVLSVEVLALARGDMVPNPDSDAIVCLFYSLLNDIPPAKGQREVTGAIVVDPVSASQNRGQTTDGQPTLSHGQTLLNKSGVDIEVVYVRNEQELVEKFIEFVKSWDPDMLVGWEVQTASWGYLLNRAAHLSINLCEQLSRIQGKNQDSHNSAEKDEWGADTMSEIHIAGRIVINLWRILRHEVTLNIYTFENTIYHVLHRRVPKFSHRSLTTWWQHRTHLHRWRTIEYFVTRVRGNLQIMDQIDLIGQTSEFARVFGIEFYHVLSRGSQYRVESMMLRIAKPMNFTAVSPGVQQRARQKAPECIPLTLEPESKFYTEPVVVLDFQSLYPSIMIAYNYCYSTCLGRLRHLERAHEGDFEFGCSTLNVPPSLLKKLEKDVNICPNGVVFVKQHIRKGIISGMVEDILQTRLMVKKSMKQYKDDKTLQRLLHARQLGLKLIANVTFGYTAANYSGRMACVEVGDSIVRKARETLERAIHLVENTSTWNARVVYGDTDSLFISLPGRTKDEAFKIGQDIADAVTADNPKPVKLKFEKVYLPCVLQTKKRYVGFMYETPEQVDPVFDAKGIETVRRDGCGAVSKILERSLKILFTSRDMSLVKKYVQQQILKLLEGRADIQDFIFAKEYRGMAGYKPAATVPALEIAKRRLAKDRCSEPRVGERVPYVIVYGTPGLPLIQLVREPQALLYDPSLRLNATYYITKAILPPLGRAFGLMGVDVQTWYTDLPRINRIVPPSYYTSDQKKGTISQYFTTLNCPVCEETMVSGVCPLCHDDPQRMAVILNDRVHRWEHTHARLSQVCYSCMRTQDSSLPCSSLDCPVLFRMLRATRDVSQVPHLRQIQHKLLKS